VLLRVGPVHAKRRHECKAETYPDFLDSISSLDPLTAISLHTMAEQGDSYPHTNTY